MSTEIKSDLSIPLRGPSGEPVDFTRTARSHGLANVAPFSVSDEGRCLTTVIRTSAPSVRLVELRPNAPPEKTGKPGSDPAAKRCHVLVSGPRLSTLERREIRASLVRILALDVDLQPFYDAIADDPLLSWADEGAGRMARSQTIFEDVVRTICTTNCAFAATRRMITTMVAELGEPARAAAWSGSIEPEPTWARAFPTPSALAEAGVTFLRERARLGYRAEYVATIAERTATGDLDLERLRPSAPNQLDEKRARAELLELPGIGPYGASHAMMLMGRYSAPILDSWSRPAYARVAGKVTDDRAIARRFSPYGPYAGLAFWLVVTRDWVPQTGSTTRPAAKPV